MKSNFYISIEDHWYDNPKNILIFLAIFAAIAITIFIISYILWKTCKNDELDNIIFTKSFYFETAFILNVVIALLSIITIGFMVLVNVSNSFVFTDDIVKKGLYDNYDVSEIDGIKINNSNDTNVDITIDTIKIDDIPYYNCKIIMLTTDMDNEKEINNKKYYEFPFYTSCKDPSQKGKQVIIDNDPQKDKTSNINK